MKNLKKVLALVLAVAMLMGIAVTASAADYKDADDIAYADAVEILSALGILDGFPDGTFQPKGTLTRGQAAKIVSIIHNATVVGKIQDIGSLYANSGNWFVDSKDHWARAYINYCRVCKLADGMTATTYVPEGLLTGTQFLKMMLNTLEFDSTKEGYLGTGWDINVLERANQIGLTNGLAKGWKAADPVKRDEAAQIIYNALTRYMVEYGQKAKLFGTSDPDVANGNFVYTEAFITGEHVSAAGHTLAQAMGVSSVLTVDAFYRPCYVWTFNGKSYVKLLATAAEYKVGVNECDLLKDIGLPETSTRSLKVTYNAVDGALVKQDYKMTHVDKACKDTDYGCTGTLTQVFKVYNTVVMPDGSEKYVDYAITEIHTWLGKVTATAAASHGKAATATIELYDKAYDCKGQAVPATVEGDSSLTKGTYVNVWYSFLTEAAERVETAQNKTGVLRGANGNNWQLEATTIDSTKYLNNCRFALGFEDSTKIENNGKLYTWFFDFYGNVIGRTDVGAAASNWYVIDKIWDATASADGVYKVKAVLVDLDAKLINAEIAAISTEFKGTPTPVHLLDKETDYDKKIHDAYINNTAFYDELYLGTDNKDVYSLVDGIEGDPTGFKDAEYITHVATDTIRAASLENKDGTKFVKLTEKTRFLVKGVDGTYKAYTGYKALPTLSATWIDYTTDDNGYATIVYLKGAIYSSDTVIGFVKEGYKEYNWRNGYKLIEVAINGEVVLLGVKDDVLAQLTELPGLYEFRMLGDDNGVSAVQAAELQPAGKFTVDNVSDDHSAAEMTTTDEAYKLTSGVYALNNAKIFDANGKATTSAAVKAGQTLLCYIIDNVYNFYIVG